MTSEVEVRNAEAAHLLSAPYPAPGSVAGEFLEFDLDDLVREELNAKAALASIEGAQGLRAEVDGAGTKYIGRQDAGIEGLAGGGGRLACVEEVHWCLGVGQACGEGQPPDSHDESL
jgi:hypothetical protein